MLMHRRGIILGPIRAVAAHVSPLPIAILILLVRLMRIGVHTIVDVGGRNAWLDMPHAEDLSATPLANLTAQVAGGVVEASGNVWGIDSRLELCSGVGMNDMGRMQQDRTNAAARGRGRVEMHRDAGGVRR
jgi:hypothetical protein